MYCPRLYCDIVFITQEFMLFMKSSRESFVETLNNVLLTAQHPMPFEVIMHNHVQQTRLPSYVILCDSLLKKFVHAIIYSLAVQSMWKCPQNLIATSTRQSQKCRIQHSVEYQKALCFSVLFCPMFLFLWHTFTEQKTAAMLEMIHLI